MTSRDTMVRALAYWEDLSQQEAEDAVDEYVNLRRIPLARGALYMSDPSHEASDAYEVAFREALNSRYGSLEIDGCTYDADEILGQMDPAGYERGLREYVTTRTEKINE